MKTYYKAPECLEDTRNILFKRIMEFYYFTARRQWVSHQSLFKMVYQPEEFYLSPMVDNDTKLIMKEGEL